MFTYKGLEDTGVCRSSRELHLLLDIALVVWNHTRCWISLCFQVECARVKPGSLAIRFSVVQMIVGACVYSLMTQFMYRIGKNHIYIYGVYTVFLAGKSPNIRSNTVYIYSSGQP